MNWSPDGTKLAAGGLIMGGSEFGKSDLVAWDTSTWETVFEQTGEDDTLDVMYGDIAWSPDSHSLASGINGMGVLVHDIQTGKIISSRRLLPLIVSRGRLMDRVWLLLVIWLPVYDAGRSARTKLFDCSISAQLVSCKLHGHMMVNGLCQELMMGKFVSGQRQQTNVMVSSKRIKILYSALHGPRMETNLRQAGALFEFGIPIRENSSNLLG